ncbi:Aminopeptidase M1 [Diplonema papillatum]|nr:Aminopeptidase M1 [Diplonema papillatum]KAJ9452548.1 Aminopeptidase M1 [Diplonema papillatum]
MWTRHPGRLLSLSLSLGSVQGVSRPAPRELPPGVSRRLYHATPPPPPPPAPSAIAQANPGENDTPTRTTMAETEPVQRELLPDDVLPVEYTLKLEPNLETFKFTGSVTIDLKVQKPVKALTLHSRQLAFDSAYIEADGVKQPVEGISTNVKDTTVTFALSEEVTAGKKTKLVVDFIGTLNDQMAGFYRSRYTATDGSARYMATTQFEATDARRCFPCWDEPARKAVFHVTIVAPKGLEAVSNMIEKRSVLLKDGRREVSFMPTPLMSSYLLAFCVGEFDFIQGTTKEGTIVRCICMPGKAADLQFALHTGIKATEFYNDFFNIAYPLPKLDMIAIPDFAAGAMENWGLVTYREVDLLLNPAKASQAQKERVATVVTHEIAHQWFGNLVTMAWWDDLWLNEGFACWMQTFCADAIYPQWALTEVYVSVMQSGALAADALRSSHPIQVPIGRAETVEEVFDRVSYQKGGSVVRMAYALLGRDKFRAGLTSYLNKHSYANTESADLWQAWEDASGQPIKDLMSSWTEQMGFPLITVDKATRAGGKVTLEVSQAWFLADGSVKEDDEKKQWVVPLIAGTSDGVQPVTYLKEKSGSIEVKTGGWVKLNFGQEIPLRVKYTPELLEDLSNVLPSLSPVDRMGMINDAVALSKAGKSSIVDLVNVMKGYKGEKNVNVWSQLISGFASLKKGLRYSSVDQKQDVNAAINRFALGLAKPIAEELGWDHKDADSDVTKRLRASVVSFVIATEDSDATFAEAKRRFDAYYADRANPLLHADIRNSVMKLVVRKGGDLAGTLRKLREIHDATDDSSLRRDLTAAMGAAPDKGALREQLAWITEGGTVRTQDMIFGFFGVAMNTTNSENFGKDVLKEYYATQYDALYSLVGETSKMIFASFVNISFATLTTEDEVVAMEKFWKEKNIEGISKTICTGMEEARSGIMMGQQFASSAAAKTSFWEGVSL